MIITNAIKSLKINKLKTILIYSSLTFSIISIFLITSISNGIITMYSNILKSDGDIIVTQAKISDTFFSNVDTNLVSKIEKINGVKKVSSLIVGASPVDKIPIVAIYGCSENRFMNYKLIKGNYPKDGEAIIGKAIYDHLTNRDQISISDKVFKISGVFESEFGFENGGIVITLSNAGILFNKSASMLLVNIDVSKSIDSVVNQINQLSDKIDSKSTKNFIQTYNQFKIIQNSSFAISFIAFSMGLLSIASIMSITVNERNDEFGIMRALGLSTKRIISTLIIESSIIGLVSFVSAFFISNIILFFMKYSDLFQGYINGEIDLTLSLGVFTATILMSALGAIIPSYNASKIDPIILINKAGR